MYNFAPVFYLKSLYGSGTERDGEMARMEG